MAKKASADIWMTPYQIKFFGSHAFEKVLSESAGIYYFATTD